MKNLSLFFIVFPLIQITILAQSGWFQQTSGTTSYLLSVHFTDNNTGWAVGEGGTIRKTTDGGTSWSSQTSGTTSYLLSVYFTDNITGWVVGGGGTILKTTDGGTNWNPQISGTTEWLTSVHFTDNDTGWAAGDGGGYGGTIRKTIDGGISWNSQTIGTTEGLWSVYFTDNITGWTVGGDGTIFNTIDGGANWNSQTSGSNEWLYSVHFTDQNTGWAVGDFSTILKTTDGGVNWTAQIIGEFYYLESVHFIDNYTGWIVGDWGIILNTTDGGTNWNSQTSGTTLWLYSVHFTDQNNGWAVGEGGTILHTINGGIPVELVSFNASVSDCNVTLSWITASELNNSGFEVQRENLIKNNGWQKISFIEGKGTITEIQYYSFIDENVPVGKYQYRLKQIDFDGSFEYSDVVEVTNLAPTKFALYQNYPNPFNPKTKIRYQISQQDLVTLTIYDVLGNKVATLVNEEKPAGDYNVEFRIDNLPAGQAGAELSSGIYFYQLKAGDFIQTKKMILIK